MESKNLNGLVFGSGQPLLTGTQLKALDVAVPPLNEQKAIAAALSDVDALLNSLDRLIAKKRDLKHAAMQQLLTGQTRLPGFHGEWEVKSFREVFNIAAGGDLNPKLSAGERDQTYCYPIYSNAVTDRGLYGYCSYADHPAGSITITARGTIGIANFRDHKYTAIGRVLVLEPKREVAGEFFAEFINSRVRFAVESTGVPQLTAPQIGGYLLAVPAVSEQTAIDVVISDMNAELATLMERRDKIRLLKQGIMQELLTGRTRLV